jgi:hypothetical protein
LAKDGEIGHVEDIYFDNEKWTARYLVVDTGEWLAGKKVLISPISVADIDPENKRIVVNLTRSQVENSPDIDTDRPVSRQKEIEYHQYYAWPYYWGGAGLWGSGNYPAGLVAEMAIPYTGMEEEGDPHLHSIKEVTGYYIHARDGNIGHVEDFILQGGNWSITYLVIDTANWLPGKHVVVSREWIEEISWENSEVTLDLTKDEIKSCPEYNKDLQIDRDYEQKLHDHYQKEPYWKRKSVGKGA